MCARAREELRRPGLRGGGGGKPLLARTVFGRTTGLAAAEGVTTGAAFLLTTMFTGLGTAFATGFVTGLTATLAVSLTEIFEVALGTGLVVTLADKLAAVLALALTGVGLTTGLADFLTAGWAAVFEAGLGLTADLGTVFDGALAVVLTTGLLPLALTAFLAGVAGLPAVLIALSDFAGFAFTACLLWDAAAG